MSIPLHSDVYPAIDYSITAGTLKGKVAVIVGASRGIGQQIAQCLAKAGATVALLSISGNNAETKELCEKEGVNASSWKVDITDEKDTERVFREIVEEMGDVDVLVNNAATQRRRPFAMDNVVDWWRVIEINLKGVRSLVCRLTVAHVYYSAGFAEYEKEEFGMYYQYWITGRDSKCAFCNCIFFVKGSSYQSNGVSST